MAKNNAKHADVWSSDEKSRIVESFQWDVDLYINYNTKLEYRNHILCCCIAFCMIPCIPANVKDKAHSFYLAVTKDEILFCQKQIKQCWRLSCCDQGEIRKTIPLDRVQDVVLKAPAGDCCPAEMLHKVEIQTAGTASAAPGVSGAELCVIGLQDASRFADTVRRLKREKGHTEFDGASGAGRVGVAAPEQLEMSQAILTTLKGIESKTEQSVTLLGAIEKNTKK